VKLEDYENWDRKRLRHTINECFEHASNADPVDRLAVLLEAQVYTRELERRSDSRVSIRDFILEIVVIALIGWEIHMGYQQAWQQNQAFEKENVIWEQMETSSKATADTLTSLAGTTALMNSAVQMQLGLLYEVNVVTTFDNNTKRIGITNVGHTPIILLGTQFWDDPPKIETKSPRIVAPGINYSIDGTWFYDAMSQRISKVGDGEFVPWVIYLRNGAGKKIAVRTYLAGKWENDVFVIRTQVVSIRQGEWPDSRDK
jgi:hypothetical protein